MRVLVTGSRNWTDIETIRDTFNAYFAENPLTEVPTLVSGHCPRGADYLAEQIFLDKGYDLDLYPANWSLGRAAGPIRNQKMVETAPDVCFAFILDNSKGATHCSQLALKAQIPTIIVHRTTKD